MGTARTFEDLEVWKKARALARAAYAVTLKNSFAKDYSLKDHINKTAGSVMDNIAEGFGRGGNRELIQFLSISKGSCAEVRSQLYRAFDRKHIGEQEFNELQQMSEAVSKQLAGFINYLKNSDLKGPKYMKEPEVSYNIDDQADCILDQES
jgi:four helix bundle protein